MESEFEDNQPINFLSERAYNSEMENIINIIKDNKSDWKDRLSAIQRIGSIVLGNYGNSIQFIRLFNQKLFLNISIQMCDIRTTLMKESCRILIVLTGVLNEKVENGVEKIFSSIILFKLIGSANKVISDTASECALNVIKNVHSFKIICRIYEQVKNKNSIIKVRLCHQIIYILSLYPRSILNKASNIFEQFILTLTDDSNNDVRLWARKVYLKLLNTIPDCAYHIYEKFDTNIQKIILEEGRLPNFSEDNFINSGQRKLTNEIKYFKDEEILSYDSDFNSTEMHILDLIHMINASDISHKLSSFEEIYILFNELYANIDNISKSTINNLVNVHILNLSESYYKLTIQVTKNLIKFINYLDGIFSNEDIFNILKLVIINISSKQESISQNTYSLYDVMRKKIDPNVLIKPLIEIIDIETSYDLVDISLDIILPLIDLSATVLSDQTYLNSFIYKLVKISLLSKEQYGENNIIDKIMECFENIWKKFPKQICISLNSLDAELRQYIMYMIAKYKKKIFNYINQHMFDENNQFYELLEQLDQSNYEGFYKQITSDLNNFLNSLVKIKTHQIYNILNMLHDVIYTHSELFEEDFGTFFENELFLLETFPNEANIIKKVLDITIKSLPELFLINLSSSKKYEYHVIQTILNYINTVINTIDKTKLIALIPSFIGYLYFTLNHTISDIPK
jgi:hypothetical protein